MKYYQRWRQHCLHCLTLFSLLILFKLLYTAKTVACMPIYIVSEFPSKQNVGPGWSRLHWSDYQGTCGVMATLSTLSNPYCQHCHCHYHHFSGVNTDSIDSPSRPTVSIFDILYIRLIFKSFVDEIQLHFLSTFGQLLATLNLSFFSFQLVNLF